MMSYLRLGLAIAFLLALGGAFFYGQHVGEQRCQAAQAKAVEADRKTREATIGSAQDKDAEGAAADVQRQTVVREITREVPKLVDRPVYRNVCVDADGVRLIDRAVEAANGRGATAVGPVGNAGGVQSAASDGRR